MLKVSIDEIEMSDYDICFDAKFEGHPFTGTATEDDGDIHSEYVYKDGTADGRWFSTYSDGSLQSETIFDMGREVSELVWNKDGKLSYEYMDSPLHIREYFDNGITKYDKDECGYTFYYPDGNMLRQYIYSEKCEIIYSRDGEWLVKHRAEGNKELIFDVKNMEFNDEAMMKHWKQGLVDDINLEIYAGGYPEIYPYFTRWISSLISHGKRQQAEEIIIEMIEQEYLAIKYDGITLAMKNKMQSAIPYILKVKDIDQSPAGYGNHAYGFTIGQIARMSLNEIRGN